ncbi:DNA-directed RNA polymerase II core subunit [Sorochytrium milnesiophthora]
MNAPERFELFVLPEGKKKITIIRDTRLPNAATFEFQREDHTTAGLIRAAMLKDKRVIFAGYKVPHPLEHLFELKVQTTADTTPWQALADAMEQLVADITNLKTRFTAEVTQAKEIAANMERAQHGGLDAEY